MTTNQISSVAFLIDADNLSPKAVDEAFDYLKKSGAVITVRRAYGGLEKLAGMKEVLLRHAVHAFVNQGKGTTDVALVVDAMDLLHRDGLPATVAIGSSDADFAPFAVRLREAGVCVICFAKKAISADSLPLPYDEVFFVDEPANNPPVVDKTTDAVAIAAVSVKPVNSIEVPLMVKKEKKEALFVRDLQHAESVKISKEVIVKPSSSSAGVHGSKGELGPLLIKNRVTAAQKIVKKTISRSTGLDVEKSEISSESDLMDVLRILEIVPDLKNGKPLAIGAAAKLLHDAKLIGKTAPSTKLFKKYPTYFELTPTKLPNQVRFLRRMV